jgi:hypothetical protein
MKEKKKRQPKQLQLKKHYKLKLLLKQTEKLEKEWAEEKRLITVIHKQDPVLDGEAILCGKAASLRCSRGDNGRHRRFN